MDSEDIPSPVHTEDVVPVIEMESDDEIQQEVVSPVLVGRLVVDFKRFNTRVIGEGLTRIWGLKHQVHLTEVRDNVFVFQFTALNEKERILAGSPWAFAGHLLWLKEWSATKTLEEVNFEEGDIWVQVSGLTPEQMTIKKVQKMAFLFGGIEEIDLPPDNSPYWGDSFKMRVRIPLHKALPTGFVCKKRGDQASWAAFQYEKLGDYCYYCARLGHVEKECPRYSEDKRKGKVRAEPITGIFDLRAPKTKPRRFIPRQQSSAAQGAAQGNRANSHPQTTRGKRAEPTTRSQKSPEDPRGSGTHHDGTSTHSPPMTSDHEQAPPPHEKPQNKDYVSSATVAISTAFAASTRSYGLQLGISTMDCSMCPIAVPSAKSGKTSSPAGTPIFSLTENAPSDTASKLEEMAQNSMAGVLGQNTVVPPTRKNSVAGPDAKSQNTAEGVLETSPPALGRGKRKTVFSPASRKKLKAQSGQAPSNQKTGKTQKAQMSPKIDPIINLPLPITTQGPIFLATSMANITAPQAGMGPYPPQIDIPTAPITHEIGLSPTISMKKLARLSGTLSPLVIPEQDSITPSRDVPSQAVVAGLEQPQAK
ncbi:hypothetical protein Tsubulata_015555 [Turnera subulata]|uniref:CCHC-type domain-containing protein n=1 Tax=Turnera subulata TaxID=218843 RepID=A0A9Q0FEN1_9ROSI|nr:hypothetical protein Tsubulata_015555 [Turnera subulata]